MPHSPTTPTPIAAMGKRMIARFALAFPLALLAACADGQPPAEPDSPAPAADMARWAAQCGDDDAWDKPGPPFRIHGGSYYVGTCGITAILVTGPEGHVLIDGGPDGAALVIADNIAALGFDLSDVKLLLHSHEHFDHVAGLAELQRRSGARLLASDRAAPVLASGRAAPDDPQADVLDPFPAMRVDGQVAPDRPVTLGPLSLTPVATPGHTPGALTWHWRSCAGEGDGADCRAIVYADSLSPISGDAYRFSDHSDVVAGFRDGLARLAALDCDILLTPHPAASGMRDRLAAGDLADPAACADYAANITRRLDARLAEENR